MENIIEVKNLTKKFGHFTAVDNVSFNIRKKEIFGFLGPNGAGKSTTIRMLTTLLRPTSGDATIASHDVVKKQDQVRKHIGLVAEKIILYDHLTARENLEFFGRLFHLPKDEIKRRSEKWIGKLHMTEWLNAQVGTFSTGMKQRINIVRALLTEPDILFLDEPTLGLDPQTTHMIRGFIRELNNQGVSVLLTTHDMLEAEELSDRIAIIDHGKIAASDTVENLKKRAQKENPTLEDVFLAITGKEIRDVTNGRVATRGHMHGPIRANNRVR
ncbi:MAG: ABC transporter ATP-binding protein [Candidatus Berkelbacteria bacterium]|nr:ABC transporter ATP-binding protein [Candidatus Berkelbacteria bacterium]